MIGLDICPLTGKSLQFCVVYIRELLFHRVRIILVYTTRRQWSTTFSMNRRRVGLCVCSRFNGDKKLRPSSLMTRPDRYTVVRHFVPVLFLYIFFLRACAASHSNSAPLSFPFFLFFFFHRRDYDIFYSIGRYCRHSRLEVFFLFPFIFSNDFVI